MAQNLLKKVKKYFSGSNWQESYATLVLGAIIVIVLGLLIANFFTRRNQEIGTGEQTTQTQEETTQEYKVAVGDSLSAISQKFYDSQEFWPVIARVNNVANPNLIFVDIALKIPPKSEAENIRAQLTQTTYQVEAGDTLFSISEKVYGDGSKWVVLDRANKIGRLPNGNPLVYSGSTLVIPR